MPKLYLIPNSAPNAFATGRNPQHAAVAVTEGILRVLDEEELAGVIGHELAHLTLLMPEGRGFSDNTSQCRC